MAAPSKFTQRHSLSKSSKLLRPTRTVAPPAFTGNNSRFRLTCAFMNSPGPRCSALMISCSCLNVALSGLAVSLNHLPDERSPLG